MSPNLHGMHLLLAIISVGILGCDTGRQERSDAAANAPWHSTVNVDISRALAKKSATGCGEYRYKSINGDSEYLVECNDGHQLRFYQVWPKIDEVTGPFAGNPY